MHKCLQAVTDAGELEPFRDEPKQMRAATSGKIGELKLVFSCKNERHILSHLYRVAPLLVQRALYWDDAMPELPICSVISVGGGVLQGDRYHIDIQVEKNSCGHVTSQGANRIHQMDANYAAQYQSLTLQEGAYLEYLPDFTILYKQSRYISQTDIVMSDGATLLYGEMLMLGRKHHQQERMEFDLLSLLTRVKHINGQSLFTEKILLESDMPEKVSRIKNFDVFANVLCLTPPEMAVQINALFKSYFADDKTVFSAISSLPNQAGLMLRVVGCESYQVRVQVTRFWQVVRQVVKQKDLPSKFIWH